MTVDNRMRKLLGNTQPTSVVVRGTRVTERWDYNLNENEIALLHHYLKSGSIFTIESIAKFDFQLQEIAVSFIEQGGLVDVNAVFIALAWPYTEESFSTPKLDGYDYSVRKVREVIGVWLDHILQKERQLSDAYPDSCVKFIL